MEDGPYGTLFFFFLISFLILVSFNSSTWQRFLKTIQPVQVVTISQGTGSVTLPPNLKKIILILDN